MRMDRLTTLAQEALAAAQSLAITKSHAELTPLHILAAMLEDRNSLAHSIIAKAGMQAERIAAVTSAELTRLPTVTGEGVGPQTSSSTAQVLAEAEKEAKNLHDAYISTEHLLLALAEIKSDAKEVLTVNGLNRKRLLDAISALRQASGVEHITDPEIGRASCRERV